MDMRDPQSLSLSSGCFLDALTSGQLGPTVWSSFVLPPHALSSPEVGVQCRTAPRLLLALDYEGSLVPRVSPPVEARPTPALLLLLSQLAQAPGVEVAVVSDRPLAELRALLPVPGLVYLGTHELEIPPATGKTRRLIPTGAFTTVIGRLRKKVVVVRPLDVNKEKTLQTLLTLRNTAALPVYLGNEATAEDAFRTVNGRGLAILVADPPGRTAARYYLQNPAQVSCFLSRVLSLRQNGPEQNLTPSG
jgi:trehalose-6-phosphatase